MPREESSRSVGGSKIDGGCVGEEEEEEEEVWVRQRAGRPGAGGRVGVRSDSTRWREEDDQQQQQQQSRPAAVLQQSGQVNSGEPESLPAAAAAAAADWQWLAHCMLQSAAPEQQPPLFGFYFCLS